MRMGWWWGALVVALALGTAGCEREGLGRVRGALSAGPEQVDFGAVSLGDMREREITLTNQSRLTVTVLGIRSGLASVAVEEGSFSLSPGEERKVRVRFSPAVEGEVKGQLQVETDLADASARTQALDLQGLGVRGYVDVSSTLLDFGRVELDTTEVLEVTLTNPTNVESTATVTLEGTDADEFSTSEAGKSLRLQPGEVRSLPIAFRPLRLGSAQAAARVTRCPICEPAVVQLTGTGVYAMLEVLPTVVDFGRVALGARAEQRVTLRNNGSEPLHYSSSAISGDDAGVFRLESEPAHDSLLAAGGTAEVVVSFSPVTTGPAQGRPQLELGISADNTQGKKVRLPILAEGGVACLTFQPSTLDFGPVPEGMSSTKTVLAFNRCKDEVVLSELQLRLGSGGFFTLPQGPSGVPLAGGAKVPVQVTFTPKAGAGDSSAELVGTVLQGRTTATAVLPISGRGRLFDPCQYRIDPTPLAFGQVQVGSEVTLALSLVNVGTTECFVSGMQLAAGSDLAFQSPLFEGTLLAPGARALLPVSFRPAAAGSFAALAEAWVNHPTNGHPTVPVSGQGVNSCFTVEPGTVDFGVTKLACGERTREVMVFNRCSAPVTLTSVALEDATSEELALAPAPQVPFTLAPGTQRALRLSYAPLDEGLDAAALRVTADGVGTMTVGLLGQGLSKPTQTDRFVQESQSKVDVLFIVDNSGSMMEEQNNLGQNFAAFMSSAMAQGVDYHIGVTTTGIEASPGGWSVCPGGAEGGEGGRLFPVDGSTPRIITPTTANASGVFATNVKVGWCHWNEQGLEAAYRALATPLVNNTDDPRTALANDGNGGFLRDDARLVLVFVTDEEDFSPQSVAFYETFFKGLKGNDPSLLSISAIIGPENLASCPTASSTGSRYLALARATGGATESICTPNWSASLQKLSDSAFGPKRSFPLSQTPADPSQLAVVVNGVPVTGGWRYDAASNSIVFEPGSVPAPGALIEVSYPLGC